MRINSPAANGSGAAIATAERDVSIDTVRGIACILLVLYHVIGVDKNSGLRLDSSTIFHQINVRLAYVRMPLFTLLSGVVYAYRPMNLDNAGKFMEGKVMRLILPLIFVGSLFTIFQSGMPGTNNPGEATNLIHDLFYPHAHFWFIQALFVVCSIIMVLECTRLLDRRWLAVMVFAASSVALVYPPHIAFFSVNRAAYLLPFFLIGLIYVRFGFGAAVVCVALSIPIARADIAVGAAVGVLLLRSSISWAWLAAIGYYSYSIYLFHVFGTAGSRIAWERVGVESLPVLIVSGTVAGILLPIAIHRLFCRSNLLSRAFLGVRGGNSPRLVVQA